MSPIGYNDKTEKGILSSRQIGSEGKYNISNALLRKIWSHIEKPDGFQIAENGSKWAEKMHDPLEET